MKSFKIFRYTLVIAFFGMLLTSCEEDGGIIGGGGILDTPPSAGLLNESGFITGDATVDPNEVFSIRYSATAGDSELEAITIRENGVTISDFSRMSVDGDQVNSNPFVLFAADRQGFTKTISIRAQESGTATYEIIVSDVNTNSETVSFNITAGSVEPAVSSSISGNFTDITPGSLLTIPLSAQPGALRLKSVAVTFDPDFIVEDLTTLYYGSLTNQFSANPHPLPEADRDGFATEVYIRVPETAGTTTYRVYVIDEDDNSSFLEFDVTTSVVSDVIVNNGVLFNSAGPGGTGGLDLDEGIGTGSFDPLAEIRDAGINADLAFANNWLQQIGSSNESVIRELIPNTNGLSESFTFTSIVMKSQLISLFDAGVGFTATDNMGRLISNPVSVGSMFVVQNGNKFYAIRIAEINVTPDNNGDSYRVDIIR